MSSAACAQGTTQEFELGPLLKTLKVELLSYHVPTRMVRRATEASCASFQLYLSDTRGASICLLPRQGNTSPTGLCSGLPRVFEYVAAKLPWVLPIVWGAVA